MGRITAALCLTVGSALSGACRLPLYGEDPPQIVERWQLNYTGPCNVWLTSPRTGQLYCSSPAIALKVDVPVAAPAAAAAAAPEVDTSKVDKDALMAQGEKVYGNVCAACHQANGQGLPGMFPPLAGSGAFYGDAQNMARIVVKGLSGEIVVQGQKYNAAMPPQGAHSDYDLAAVMTYVRHSWGNDDGIVLPSDVAAVR